MIHLTFLLLGGWRLAILRSSRHENVPIKSGLVHKVQLLCSGLLVALHSTVLFGVIFASLDSAPYVVIAEVTVFSAHIEQFLRLTPSRLPPFSLG